MEQSAIIWTCIKRSLVLKTNFRFSLRVAVLHKFTVSENNKEILQSHIVDQPTAPRRAKNTNSHMKPRRQLKLSNQHFHSHQDTKDTKGKFVFSENNTIFSLN